jgi:AcrR family transcriptional regulator
MTLWAQYGDLVPDERRARMLRATMVVIARTEVSNVTMDRIAEQAGVSRVTLYREFGNRASLFEAVIAYRLMQFDRHFFERNPLPSSLACLIEEYLVATINISQRNPVTRRWIKGGMSFLHDQSQIHRVAVATWGPITDHYSLGSAPGQAVTAQDIGLWINVLQYTFARLNIEAGLNEADIRKKIRLFVAPAFA